ncbi:MAG: hypothetical protein V3U45_04885 [bacterium]
MTAKSRVQGVDKFLVTRMRARVFSSELALQVIAQERWRVLDLTAGWGKIETAYKSAGLLCVGVDQDPSAEAASYHMTAQHFLLDPPVDLGAFGVVDFEPYGMATAILEAFFLCADTFTYPLVLCVGSNPRNAVYRVGRRMDWSRHLHTTYADVMLNFSRLPSISARDVAARAQGAGLTYDHKASFQEDDMRKVMTVGVLNEA